MKRQRRSLRLDVKTVRDLKAEQLDDVAGGWETQSVPTQVGGIEFQDGEDIVLRPGRTKFDVL